MRTRGERDGELVITEIAPFGTAGCPCTSSNQPNAGCPLYFWIPWPPSQVESGGVTRTRSGKSVARYGMPSFRDERDVVARKLGSSGDVAAVAVPTPMTMNPIKVARRRIARSLPVDAATLSHTRE